MIDTDPRALVLMSFAPPDLLVSGGHAPHIYKMTPRENPQTDASDHDRALARWDDEGGASTPFANDLNAKISKGGSPQRKARMPVTLKLSAPTSGTRPR